MFRSTSSTDRFRRPVPLLVAMLAVAVVSCSTGGSDDATTATTTATAVTTPEPATTTDAPTTTVDLFDQPTADWCPSTDAVAEVVGHEVTQSMTAGGSGSFGLSYSYEGCSFDGDGNRYTVTRATVEADEDGSSFDLLDRAAQADVAASGFTAVDDLGDDAYLDGQSLVVRSGDTMVIVSAVAADDRDVTVQRDELAEDLAAIDLRGDDPSCDAPAGAVADAFGPIGEPRSGGGGSSQDGVEIQYTTCTFEADDGTEISIDVARSAPWDDWVEAKRSSTFASSYQASSIGEFASFDNGEELVVDEGDRPLRITASVPDGTPDDATALRVALAELALSG